MKLELVLVGIFGFSIYALIVQSTRDRSEPQAAEPAPAPEPEPEPEADELTTEQIMDAVGVIESQVFACGDRYPADGVVEVQVVVAPDGRVSTVNIEETPDPRLGRCVATAVKRLRLPESEAGVTFTYPFAFQGL